MAPRTPSKKAPGRNDPCWCGSGRKYKDCHRNSDEAWRSEQLKLRQAQDTLLPKIIEAAQSLPEEFPAALETFWQGKYSAEQMADLDQLEERGSERFLTWFAFDRPLSDGQTLVNRLLAAADTGGFAIEPAERTLLTAWQDVRLRLYKVAERKAGASLRFVDLLDQSEYTIADYHASKRVVIDDLVVAHLVPADRAEPEAAPTYYFTGAAAHVTGDTADKFVEFAEIQLADMRRSAPQATWTDFYRERSATLNHFVSALPTEQRDPTLVDQIIANGRIGLALTVESINQLLGRGEPDAAEVKAQTPKDND